jgi:hypothetical protein
VITQPTVLVLGAGTSIPYGYPSGIGLVKDIFANITSNVWREVYLNCGVDHKEMDALKLELYLSQRPSIDAFLEHRNEFLKAGKTAIALSLLSREVPDIFNGFEIREQGIYHYLYNSLSASWEEFKENKLSIVTFNYDRSLEFFLFSALKHSYNKSDTEIADAMQNIPIIHVHGSLGPLPWQESGGIPYYPLFGKNDDRFQIVSRVKLAVDNIVIVSEAKPKSREFVSAAKCISEAARVYFLGFGYYRVNLERLGLSGLNFFDPSLERWFRNYSYTGYTDGNNVLHNLNMPQGPLSKHYRGSALGFGIAQIQTIQNEWRIGLPDRNCDALEFLKEYADLH